MPSKWGSKEKIEAKSIFLRFLYLFNSFIDKLNQRKHEKLVSFVLLILTSSLLTFLIVPNQHFITQFNPGDIVTTDIKATQGYLLEDQVLTEKKRDAARASVPFIYNYYPQRAAELTGRFAQAFEVVNGLGPAKPGQSLSEHVAYILGFAVSDGELEVIDKVGTHRKGLQEISRIFSSVYTRNVVADGRVFASDKKHGITIIDASTGKVVDSERFEGSVRFLPLDEALKLLRKTRLDGMTDGEVVAFRTLLGKLLQPNLVLDRDATEKKKDEAASGVGPVLFQIKRGEMLVREGERISEEQAFKMNKISEARKGISQFYYALGIFGLILVIFYFPYRFSKKNIRKFNPSCKDLLLLTVVSLAIFLLLKIALNLSSALGMIFPYINSENYFYLLPFAAGPMVIRIILNSEVALVYCLTSAPLLGIMFNNSLSVVIYALLGGVIGAHGVRQCKDRGTIYTAGLKVSVVNMAIAVPFQVLNDSMLSMQVVYAVIFACVGGILNSLVVSATTPAIESVFHYTTDIKLLELSNLNSRILRDLMIRAPGTYHHSVMVGNLVEAAAESINANPLLARVAAYYHDIGKVSKPGYFIENIGTGENKHHKLSPNMSALILISHVKEGAELAKEKRLGRQITDIIRQHHGTALIKYFFQKAKTNEGNEAPPVDELDFRYPGPKPQTREAGLVMLADCVEAASRTLTDPTPARIQGMVQKIINNIFIDGQLEECELSLKSLHEIAKSFNRVLSAIYHQRIDYPEPVYKVNERKKYSEYTNNEQATTPSDSVEKSEKGGGEDIKRLGISR